MNTGSDCTSTGLFLIRVHIGWMEARQRTAKIRISMISHAAFDTQRAVLSGIKAAGRNILMFAKSYWYVASRFSVKLFYYASICIS